MEQGVEAQAMRLPQVVIVAIRSPWLALPVPMQNLGLMKLDSVETCPPPQVADIPALVEDGKILRRPIVRGVQREGKRRLGPPLPELSAASVVSDNQALDTRCHAALRPSLQVDDVDASVIRRHVQQPLPHGGIREFAWVAADQEVRHCLVPSASSETDRPIARDELLAKFGEVGLDDGIGIQIDNDLGVVDQPVHIEPRVILHRVESPSLLEQPKGHLRPRAEHELIVDLMEAEGHAAREERAPASGREPELHLEVCFEAPLHEDVGDEGRPRRLDGRRDARHQALNLAQIRGPYDMNRMGVVHLRLSVKALRELRHNGFTGRHARPPTSHHSHIRLEKM
eukprot:CAMPEP_0176190388 /NCGR_PEP_ID=MMETSP0121_2-20121125/3914_1 /TAXON_ID=160619 /ORGANISM="Kryptoperidinium foliaceum, Strain CCMP 1326" /LENGTH=340 /DNA_ID=CAMNT_0017529011 /DNA_START=336 /DNA_END=1358 /DNA_ORIENTATION=+